MILTDLEQSTTEEVSTVEKPSGLECPKCGGGKYRSAEELSDHPGSFMCLSCHESFLA